MQKTTFRFEVIIHDDASTDNTASVIKEYGEKYPNIIIPILQKENQFSKGIRPSQTYVWPKAQGKYIALCEGDDYWIDPYKLQKQVDFLEKYLDYSFVYTPARVIDQKTGEIKKIRNKNNINSVNNIDLDWVLKNGAAWFPTASVLFKKIVVEGVVKDWFNRHSTGDYPLAILAVLKGKIGYLATISCVYRIQGNSVSNKKFSSKNECIKDVDQKYNKNISFIEFISKEINLSQIIFKELHAKENYIKISKYLDCMAVKDAVFLLFNIRLSVNYFFRGWLKLFYVLIVRRGKPFKIKS